MGCNLEFCAGRSTDALMSRWSYLRLLACICCWDWDQPENKRVMRIIINGCTFRSYFAFGNLQQPIVSKKW